MQLFLWRSNEMAKHKFLHKKKVIVKGDYIKIELKIVKKNASSLN